MRRSLWVSVWVWAVGCSTPGVTSPTRFCDRDRDQFGVAASDCPASYVVASGGDCDDAHPQVHPEAAEVCDNGVDDDCDGLVDGDDRGQDSRPFYPDDDHDGYGDASRPSACASQGDLPWAGDCDDGDAAVSPGDPEVADNGADDDCDGRVDETGDPPGTWDPPTITCAPDQEVVAPPDVVVLTAEAVDPLGQALTYDWAVVDVPTTSAVEGRVFEGLGPEVEVPIDLAGPYAFSVTAVAEDGRRSEPCDLEIASEPAEDLWIELTWTVAGDDLDLHLLAPGGSFGDPTLDCHFRNCTPQKPVLDWGVRGRTADDPSLALDDLVGTGPENIRVGSPASGTYEVVVHDYPGGQQPGTNRATVTVYVGGQPVHWQTIDVEGEERIVPVARVTFPGGVVTPL